MWRQTTLIASLLYYLFVAGLVCLGPMPPVMWRSVLTAFLFGGAFPFYFRAVRTLFLRDSLSLRIIKGGREVRIRSADRWIIGATAAISSLMALEVFLQLSIDDRIDLRAYDPFLQAVPVPGDPEFHINADGFRADEVDVDKPPDAFRIVFLGGSSVYAGEVPFESSHVRLVENMLKREYPDLRIEVLNAAVPWHSSAHSLIKYTQKVQDYEPDLIVMWHGINDLVRSFNPRRFARGEFQRDYSHYLGPVTRVAFSYFGRPLPDPLVTGIHVLDLPVNAVESAVRRRSSPVIRDVDEFPSRASFRRNLQNLAQLTKLHGTTLVLASQPFLYSDHLDDQALASLEAFRTHTDDGESHASMASVMRGMILFNQTSREVADEFGLPFIDLEPMIPKDSRHFLDDVHYTEQGNQRVAEVVFARLRDSHLVARR